MTNEPRSASLPRLRINLAAVRGRYVNATRPHTPAARHSAMAIALHDIPPLLAEVERMWTLACAAYQQYGDLRAAALATVAATEAGEPDPLFYLRDELHGRGTPPRDAGGRR